MPASIYLVYGLPGSMHLTCMIVFGSCDRMPGSKSVVYLVVKQQYAC